MAFFASKPAIVAFAGAAALAGAASAAWSATIWMTESAMRDAFVGKTLEGHYGNGRSWIETYTKDGRLDYREGPREAKGTWHFRGAVFCTFYDAAYRPMFNGGCWVVQKVSANCYEFYLAPPGLRPPEADADEEPDAISRWNARGWRREEPSTCGERPTV